MCKFELSDTNPTRTCQLASYFEKAPRMAQPNDPVLNFPALPVDNDGLCIFHSRDIDWKIKNKFSKWIDNLVAYLKCYDKVMYMASNPPTMKVVDLSGAFLIGKKTRLQAGASETLLKFRGLHLSDHIEIILDYTEISDKLVFEECKLGKTEFSFNYATIDGEFFLSNSEFGQFKFNNSRLNGGILVNHCTFNNHADFSGLTVKNMLQFSHCHFLTHAFFISSNLRCESVFFEDVHFQGRTDFGRCTIHGDAEFQECHFDQLLSFSNACFNGPVAFTANYYDDNVQFTSSESVNKLFYDNVNFTFINAEDEVQQRLIFDNVNFYLIAGKDREELLELARKNKVTIGSGCIKYRVQTQPVNVHTNDITKNIAQELAQSFTNYFTSSTGKSLGVEFVDKTINSISLFYYTDEDITLEELIERLKLAERGYWASGVPGKGDRSVQETKQKIDSFISKTAVLMKLSMLEDLGLLPENGIADVVKTVSFNDISSRIREVNLYINHFNAVKIGKVIAKPNSQVNIADKIDKIIFKPQILNVDGNELTRVRELLLLLDSEQVSELQQDLLVLPEGTDEFSLAERLSLKLNDWAAQRGVSLLDGIAASAIYEVLKAIFLDS